ncbi:MAG: hypothetical protein ABW149_10560 [Sedimenticola sp.]
MSTGKLLLHPPMACPLPDPAELEQRLRAIGLIGAPLPGTGDAFEAGDRFLHLVTFLGCSPFIRFEPENEEDDDFCYIRLSGPHEQIRFRSGSNTQRPGCPECRRKISDADRMIREWLASGRKCSCPSCGALFDAPELRWRQSGGFSRLFIEINSVFPSEAIPSQELLNHLKSECGEWEYFYIQ